MKYDDIINIEHFEPKHPRMSMYNRAAQFSAYDALTGYNIFFDIIISCRHNSSCKRRSFMLLFINFMFS